MLMRQYQEVINEASFYPEANTGSFGAILYGTLALNGEAGEIAEKVKKIWRDKGEAFTTEDAFDILLELGDCLFYITRIATELGFTLEDVLMENKVKIESRRERGTLQGSGDHR
jgi:NTP pyrophosphatase (non-canonical NTP hydrolase)